MQAVAVPIEGVRLSLWRAAALFRGITLLACLYLIFRWRNI
jgi:hypothetical protein